MVYKKGHRVSSEAERGTLLGVLLWPECWGWVSLGHKEDFQSQLSHLPTRGQGPPEACPLSPICSAELAEPAFFCLSWLSVNCTKVDLENKDIA